MKKSRLFAGVALCMLVLWQGVMAQEVITPEKLLPGLDAILKNALTQSPRMITRAVELEIAEHSRVASRAGLLPSVGGSYSFYDSRDKRGDLPGRLQVEKEYYSFSVNQPLFHWGERRNNARAGTIRKLMAEGSYRDGYRAFAQELRSVYLSLIVSKIRAKRAAFQLEYNNRLLQQAEDRHAKKVISDAAIFGVRIEAERAAISAEQAAFTYENAKATLSRLTGQPPLRDDEIPDAIPPVPGQQAAIDGLLANYLTASDLPTLELQNYKRSIEIEKLNLANQKTRLRPKFTLVAGISQDEQAYGLDIAQKYKVNSRFGGISVSWSIFDGFAARSGVRTSLASLRSMEADLKAINERLAQQAQTQARMAGFYARYSSINDRLLESGENNVISVKEQFSRGVIAQEDVSIVQLGLFDQQINAYSSRAEYFAYISDFLATVAQDPVLANLSAVK